MTATPIKRFSEFNTSETANTDILSSDISPLTAPSYLRIYATFDASGVLSLQRTNGGTTVAEQLNSGNALSANCAYVFDVITDDGETYNLQYSADATALKLIIVEIDRGI